MRDFLFRWLCVAVTGKARVCESAGRSVVDVVRDYTRVTEGSSGACGLESGMYIYINASRARVPHRSCACSRCGQVNSVLFFFCSHSSSCAFASPRIVRPACLVSISSRARERERDTLAAPRGYVVGDADEGGRAAIFSSRRRQSRWIVTSSRSSLAG